MNAGDRLDISIHDSSAGLVTSIKDLSTGQSGSMTASVANGFAQVNFEPNAATCSQSPYAFHPMYATSSEHTPTRSSHSVGCFWQLGGAHIPGTTNTFGGSSATEFGPLLFLDYPGPGFTPIHRTNDFRRILPNNPCQRR